MLRTLRGLLAFALLGLVGCGVGEGGGGGDDDDQPVPDAGVELKPLCTAQITLSGTFTAAAALDPALGCQPQGTWEVTATVSDQGACASVPIKSSYSYTLTGTGRTLVITYAKSTDEEFQGNIQATGSGGCEGSFEHIQPDAANFDQINLHAFLPKSTAGATTLTITGSGEFELWSRHP